MILDQIDFMSSQLEMDTLAARLEMYVERDLRLPSSATSIARDVLLRGEILKWPPILGPEFREAWKLCRNRKRSR